MAFHVLNSWEEEVGSDTVVKVITCDYSDIDLDQVTLAEDTPPGRWGGGHLKNMQTFVIVWSERQSCFVERFLCGLWLMRGRPFRLCACFFVGFLVLFLLLLDCQYSVRFPVTSC